MIRRGGSDWTAVAVDEVLAIFFTKRGRAAQLFENAQCSVNSLPAGFALEVRQMFPGYGSPSWVGFGALRSRLNPARDCGGKQRDGWTACFGIRLLGFGTECIRHVRVGNLRLPASLSHG